MAANTSENIDRKTVDGLGEEWAAFDQTDLPPEGHRRLFDEYFSVFPWDRLPADAEGFDLGCGSGRWAELAAKRVGTLHYIDPSEKALAVAKRRLKNQSNAVPHLAGVDAIPLAPGSQDFGYSLGVLHHIPDNKAALARCVAALKPGAPFLVYLYYRFDNRPVWFRALWKASDGMRRVISALPFPLRKGVAAGIAAGIYFPLARGAKLAEKRGAKVDNFPPSYYRNNSFYTMRTDALDRFGTRLEHRFTKAEIARMMTDCGLEQIVFRDGTPYWTACGIKRGA